MKKTVIGLIAILVVSVGFLSGCSENNDSNIDKLIEEGNSLFLYSVTDTIAFLTDKLPDLYRDIEIFKNYSNDSNEVLMENYAERIIDYYIELDVHAGGKYNLWLYELYIVSSEYSDAQSAYIDAMLEFDLWCSSAKSFYEYYRGEYKSYYSWNFNHMNDMITNTSIDLRNVYNEFNNLDSNPLKFNEMFNLHYCISQLESISEIQEDIPNW